MNKHVFITADSAAEAIEFANLCLIDKAKEDGRSKGFKDCSNYWKSEVMKLEITVDMSDEEKWVDLVGKVKKFQFEKMNLEEIKSIVAVIIDFELARSAPDSTEILSKA